MMVQRNRHSSSESDASDHFLSVNERTVDDISLQFFYRPHTISLLIGIFACLACFTFLRDETSQENNIKAGVTAAAFFFLMASTLICPNGPFTRPHPALWSMALGMSILYLLIGVFILFQSYDTVRAIMVSTFPDLDNYEMEMNDTKWGQDCDISFQRIYESIDFFVFSHLVGWILKALLIRHYGILWTISIVWEVTERFFCHLLPNFQECWWDSLILDVIGGNGIGIFLGMRLCKWAEMRPYKWESIKDIQSRSGKLKRMVLQFTPMSWTNMRWLDPNSSFMRILAIGLFIFSWQIAELNTFFLKHIFKMPPSHIIVFVRIFWQGLMAAPSISQYYSFVTDPQCKRLGTQCWIYLLTTGVEILITIKFGQDMFKATQYWLVFFWVVFVMVASVIFLYATVIYMRWSKNFRKRKAMVRSTPVSEDSDSDIQTNSIKESYARRRLRKRTC